jgi:hypothetical protein
VLSWLLGWRYDGSLDARMPMTEQCPCSPSGPSRAW